MKKVLALVLAAVMVCTMAFAVGVGGTTTTTTPGSYNKVMQTVTPGESIILTRDDLGFDSTYGKDSVGNFDPTKNTVSVNFTGSVASQGWVKDTDVYNDYVYVLTTAASDSAVLDQKADIIINSITTSIVGVAGSKTVKYVDTFGGVTKYIAATPLADYVATEAVTTDNGLEMSAATTATPLAMAFDVGREATEAVIGADGKIAAATVATPDVLLYTVKLSADGTKSAGTYAIENSTGNKMAASVKLNAGDKVYTTVIAALSGDALTAVNNNVAKNNVAYKGDLGKTAAVTVTNVPMTITCDNAADGWKMYMVNKDGTVVDLGATFDNNKVLTATAKITGPVIVTNGALTATAASTGSTGTTTNPETGANDVIGVAAALAVVALVSGAAISLKK